jgi:hypothetical protein
MNKKTDKINPFELLEENKFSERWEKEYIYRKIGAFM